MKRIYLIIVILAIVGMQAAGQVHGSVIVAPTRNVEPVMRAGIDLDIQVSPKYYFMPGIYWAHRAYKDHIGMIINGEECYYKGHNSNADFIVVPMRMALNCPYPHRKFEMRLYTGPYVAYGIDGHTDFRYRNNGIETNNRHPAFGENGNWSHRWEAGLQVGLDAYIRDHWVAGVFAEYGLTRSVVDNSSSPSIVIDFLHRLARHNFAMGLNLGYRF